MRVLILALVLSSPLMADECRREGERAYYTFMDRQAGAPRPEPQERDRIRRESHHPVWGIQYSTRTSQEAAARRFAARVEERCRRN